MKTRFTFLSVLAVLFTAALAPVGTAKAVEIIKGPYLQQVTQTSIVIMWETDVASGSRVDYGSLSVEDNDAVIIHEIELTGLTHSSEYNYTVKSTVPPDGPTVTSDPNTFTTAPETGQSFSFVAYGDSRTDYETHAAVVAAIRNSEPDIVIHTGDLVRTGSYEEWGPQFFTPAHSLMTNTTMFPVMGNHEGSGTEFREFFSLPSENEQWYSFTYGCVQFIALDTTVDYSPGGSPESQYEWLKSELDSSDSAWLIVYFHHPPYTCSSSHSDETDVKQDLVPLFEENGNVDIVFNGHSHAYERYFHNGIYYIVTGGGGAPLHSLPEDTQEPIRQVGESKYHHCLIDVTSSSLTLEALDNDGVQFDTITIEKTAKASNPNPEDKAKNVPVDTVLSWRKGIGADSHDVRFGTDDPPPFIQNQDGTSYGPATMDYETKYYWRIDEVGTGGTVNGNVWSFTTEVFVPELPWSDDFESGSFATGGWTTSGNASASSKADYSGIYGAEIKGTAWIEKAVSTVGFSDINIKYVCKTKGLDDGEYLYVEWYDGSDWHELDATQNTTWSPQNLTCGESANDNADFKVRFRTNASNSAEYAYVDDVEITNIPSEPDNTPPTPDPLTWYSLPLATGPTSISMTATTAEDPSGVEYSFECTDGGGNDSGWQDSPTYHDTGLSPVTTYTYQVKARDKSANQNVTGLSTEESATTTESGTTIHVESIDMGLLPTGKNWKAVAAVVISPAQAGATVVGDWYLNESVIQTGATGVTDGVGYTKITLPPKKAESGDTFKFVVTDVVLSGYVYDPGQGVTEGSDTVL